MLLRTQFLNQDDQQYFMVAEKPFISSIVTLGDCNKTIAPNMTNHWLAISNCINAAWVHTCTLHFRVTSWQRGRHALDNISIKRPGSPIHSKISRCARYPHFQTIQLLACYDLAP